MSTTQECQCREDCGIAMERIEALRSNDWMERIEAATAKARDAMTEAARGWGKTASAIREFKSGLPMRARGWRWKR